MNRSLTRIVALLLVHCVLSDSAFASMTSLSPRGWERVGVRGDNFLEQALALGAAGQTRPLPSPEAESVMVHVIEGPPPVAQSDSIHSILQAGHTSVKSPPAEAILALLHEAKKAISWALVLLELKLFNQDKESADCVEAIGSK